MAQVQLLPALVPRSTCNLTRTDPRLQVPAIITGRSLPGHTLEQKSPRAYLLQSEEVTLVVNAFVRLPSPVVFDIPRSSARLDSERQLHFLSDKQLYAVENSMHRV